MATEVQTLSMGRVLVTTIDRYDNECHYEFRREHGIAIPIGEGRDYTVTVLKALWNEGIPVDWDADDLTASERKQLDMFCSDCGSPLNHRQIGPDEWENRCEECDEIKSAVNA